MGEAKQAVMTRDEAEAKIREWADYLEVDTERAFFSDVVDELIMPVKKGRLDLDYDSGIFRYRLIKPIEHQNSIKEIVEIREGNLGDSRAVIDRHKNNEANQMVALTAKRTGLEMAEVEQLSDRDITRISAIFQGFFVSPKSSR